MIARSLVPWLLLLAAGSGAAAAADAGAAGPTEAEKPSTGTPALAPLADRLDWNARERTKRGIADLEAKKPQRAREALDTALRLRPDNPVARYNAGTGRLVAGDPSATALLEQAARSAPPDLAADAWYNLGNAKLAGDDAKGAIEAYVESLKRASSNEAAKQNLELALRRLAEKQKQQQQQQQQSGDEKRNPQQQQNQQQQDQKNGSEDQKQDQQQSSSGQDSQQQGEQKRPDDANRDQQQPNGSGSPGQPSPNQGKDRSSPLPQFHDLPDMTAEQAAAILRAVENLERQARKDRAKKAAAAAASVDIDW